MEEFLHRETIRNRTGPYEELHGRYAQPSVTLGEKKRPLPIRQISWGDGQVPMPEAGGQFADYLYWKADPRWLAAFVERFLTHYGKDPTNGEEDSARS